MKRLFTTTALGSVLFCCALAFSSPAAAFQYLGEYTWNVHETFSAKEGTVDRNLTMTVGLSRVSKTHFLVQGKILTQPANALFLIIAGSGVIVGDDLHLTLHGASPPSVEYGTCLIHAHLNKTTFAGPFYHIGQSFREASSFGSSFGSGDLTIEGNIPPLNATVAPLYPLLTE